MNFDTTISRRVRIEPSEDARVVYLQGEHDISSVDLVRERLAQASAAGGRIVIDLSAATFIDTTIAVTLLDAFRADTPPRVRFVMPADTLPRRVFYRMGFGTGLPVYERLDDALADEAVR
jgi:anti-anti-sigma factor